MDGKDKINVMDTFVPNDESTNKSSLLHITPRFERETGEPEPFGDTSGIKAYPFVRTGVSWKQRILSWFRRD